MDENELMQLIDDKLEFIKPLMKDAQEQGIDSNFHYYQGYRNALLCMAEIIIKRNSK